MAAESQSADPIELLTEDHEAVKELFKEFEAAGEHGHAEKQAIAEKVFLELEIHATIEEEIFYPAVQAAAEKEGRKLVAEAIEEHKVVKTLIEELKVLTPADEQFDAKFKVLSENVEHHADEEESEMFPEAEDALADELERLGVEMRARKRQLTAARGSTRAA